MTPEAVVEIVREALMTDVLAGGAAAGDRLRDRHAISLVQIVTSIQDTAFSTIPRLWRF